jgi:hypothetical protein
VSTTPTPRSESVLLDPLRDGNDLPCLCRQLETELHEANAKLAAAEKDAETLAGAIRLIYKPYGDETEDSGNPCCSPSPDMGRAIAKALTAHDARAKDVDTEAEPVFKCTECGGIYMEKVTQCDCHFGEQKWIEGMAVFPNPPC